MLNTTNGTNVALVTEGSERIGRAVIRKLSDAGFAVTVQYAGN
ncbi:hypothetical protein [Bacillus sp. 03113]|nr:hypothetical protein [Bacillus sp. 03113]